jgi:hypothetical protein
MEYNNNSWELLMAVADFQDRKNKGKKKWSQNCERHLREHPEW